ncbi:MarR family winged helix-turn-helix transcriptional regulator [Pseudomonas mandelii]|uniref:MarR family winged helix-turn-helix transcriptional regulator n=1 Tax=Pseudomonas mandelii TaxID=75612 RepID=UPI00209CAAD1|nr:MarR family transcriptional regulator [Pseudomonas mandelii]MCO8310964.1 MarR family transcriptional regulator [Pseudomonas mandelii]
MAERSTNTIDSLLFNLTVAIQPARRAWIPVASMGMAGTGLSAPLATVLVLVWRSGPRVPQSVIAVELGVNPAAIVRTLDQGQALGLLTRRDVLEDRRVKEIKLLPKGVRLAKDMEKTLAMLRRRLIEDLSHEDIETATRVLRTLELRSVALIKVERKT